MEVAGELRAVVGEHATAVAGEDVLLSCQAWWLERDLTPRAKAKRLAKSVQVIR